MFNNLFGENAMHLFGNPIYPKKNITGGGLLMVVAAFEFGTVVQRAIQSGGIRVDYFVLLMLAVVFFIGVKTFRLGLAFVPPDSGHLPPNERRQRTTLEWVGLMLFWIALIVAPVAIIQFIARR